MVSNWKKYIPAAAAVIVITAAGFWAGYRLISQRTRQTPGSQQMNRPKPALPEPYGFGPPEFVKGALIAIGYRSGNRLDMTRTRDQAASLAVTVHDRIKNGEIPFSEAAARFSDAPSAKKGGSIGFVSYENVLNLPGGSVLFSIRPGQISRIIEGSNAFLFYKRLTYEPAFYRGIFFSYKGDPSLRKKKKKRAYEVKEQIGHAEISFKKAADRFSDIRSGPGGYIGEIVPGKKGEEFDNAVSGLRPGEVSDVFDDGTSFIIIKRCSPQQFTFSYIVYTGNTEKEAEALQKEAEQTVERIKNPPEDFYKEALRHYRGTGWDAPWYRVSKDLYKDKLDPALYDFLSQADVFDVSAPMTFANGIYIVMKEKFIGRNYSVK